MRWILSAIILLSLLAPLLAAAGTCGNGICSSDKNCSTCSLDCGKCNRASCSLDNDCSSGICCDGVCSNSCVTYTPKSAAPASPYIASVLGVDTYSLVLGAIVLIIIIEVVIAFAILRRRKEVD
jgi:hypothetical protein